MGLIFSKVDEILVKFGEKDAVWVRVSKLGLFSLKLEFLF